MLSLRASTITERAQLAIAEHQVILDALATRDPEAAAQAMEVHVEAVKARSLTDLDGGDG